LSTLIDRQYDGPVSDDRWLTATEATTALGVKPQTLYAYVSRGMIRRERRPGSRTSRYARSDVERLAEHGRPRVRADGFDIVIDQAVTRLDPAGHLAYRGWDATRAAVDARFEEVAAWLWGSTIGPHEHWSSDRDGLAVARAVQATLPDDTPLPDRLRVAVATLRPCDPLRNDRRAASVAARAGTLIATMVKALPPVDARDEPTATGSIARRLWTRVSPLEPTNVRVRALDRALSLLADHELATSTLAVRVAASTWADPYLLLLAGLAAVGGPLHGGQSELVRSTLRDAVASTPEAAIGRLLRDGEHVPGFGHQVYEGPDPRTPVLLDAIERCTPPRDLWSAARGVLAVMARDDGPHPNVDFALGVLAESTRMVHGAGEAIFAVARSAGWIAHGLEEYQHRLRYRIRATYTGPD
jgi:citrate synthase